MTTTTPERAGTRLTRRGLLAGALALGAGALGAPIFRITPAKARPGCPAPPGFPSSVEVYQQAYRNWSGEIRIDDLWTCAPRTPSDVVTVANWAVTHGYRLRARGHMHNWSPLTVTRDTTCGAPVVLVDTTQHLTDMHIISSSPAAVRVQTGTAMEALLGHLESAGYGFATVPSTGGISVGGVLAIDGHGASLPARGEVRTEGHAYGSLSNLVLSLTAVVWDERKGAYILRTFDRADPDAKAFLTHLGRAFLTEVTLEVGRNQNLRCVSHVDIPGREIFAAPGARTERTFADFVDQAGRVEALWFPFTDNPWL
jgi:FAD/FMN-containing dehydrogenase